MRARTMNGNLLQTRGEILHIHARETATKTGHGMARGGTTVCGGEGPATETESSSKNELPAQHSSIRTIQACPRGRGAQTIGIDTATDTGNAGTQKDIKTETGAPVDRGLRSKHGVEAGAQTGLDTETLCAAGEGGSRTQKDIETETGTRTETGSKRGEEAGAGTGAGTNGGELARTTVPIDSRMTTLRLKR
jgi:hypothetical protein